MNKIQSLFEAFNKENLDFLISQKKAYTKPISKITTLTDIQSELKNYDVNNFNFVIKSYGIFVYPDSKFIELAKKIDDEVDERIHFYLSVDKNKLNQIDFTEGLPYSLRGLSLAYKIYKKIIFEYGWVTSNRYASENAYNLWYNLLQDKDVYCFTSNFLSGLISKRVSDEYLLEIMGKLDKQNIQLELDDELKSKLETLK